MRTVITTDADVNARFTMTSETDPYSPTGVTWSVHDHQVGQFATFAEWSHANTYRQDLQRQVAPHGQLIHYFASTEAALEACQDNELHGIHTGDILVIPTERVVGIAAGEYPFAVTERRGKLYQLLEEDTWTESGYSSANADLGFDQDQVSRALKVAVEIGIKRLYVR
jgi:hypothetical protein